MVKPSRTILKSTRIVVLGDSVTVGNGFSGVTEETAFITLLKRRFHDQLPNIEIVRSALDGVDTEYAIKRFDRMVTNLTPDHVVIMLGLNDAKPKSARPTLTPAEFAGNLCVLTDRCIDIGAKPTLASPSPRLDIPCKTGGVEDIIVAYADAVRYVCREFAIPCINVYDQFLYNGKFDKLLPDGLHPGVDGHRLIADTFAETIPGILS
ncbi:MAG: hypothetical protein CMJ78_03945 [Planctomycetaceae bacterium]|nr:hypothetical protein [Planctomycetaceae bacterium]